MRREDERSRRTILCAQPVASGFEVAAVPPPRRAALRPAQLVPYRIYSRCAVTTGAASWLPVTCLGRKEKGRNMRWVTWEGHEACCSRRGNVPFLDGGWHDGMVVMGPLCMDSSNAQIE